MTASLQLINFGLVLFYGAALAISFSGGIRTRRDRWMTAALCLVLLSGLCAPGFAAREAYTDRILAGMRQPMVLGSDTFTYEDVAFHRVLLPRYIIEQHADSDRHAGTNRNACTDGSADADACTDSGTHTDPGTYAGS